MTKKMDFKFSAIRSPHSLHFVEQIFEYSLLNRKLEKDNFDSKKFLDTKN